MKSIELQDVYFTYNHHYGLSLYHSNIKASGRCYFINNTRHTGTVYLYKSTVSFDRESDVKFIGNKALHHWMYDYRIACRGAREPF